MVSVILLMAFHPYSPILDKNEENLKGDVKTVIEKSMNWNQEIVVQRDFNKQGKVVQIKYYSAKLDKNDSIIAEIPKKLKSLKNLNKLQLDWVTKFTYSNTNKLLEINGESKVGKEFKKSIYKYDKNDSLIFEIRLNYFWDSLHVDSTCYNYYRNDDTIFKEEIHNGDTLESGKYILDFDQKLLKSIVKKHYRSCQIETTYFYESLGKLMMVKVHEDYGYMENNSIISYLYDFENRIVKYEKNDYDSYSKERNEIIYQYDVNGNILQEFKSRISQNIVNEFQVHSYNSRHDLIHWYSNNGYQKDSSKYNYYIAGQERFEYKYDRKDNWIECVKYRPNYLFLYDEVSNHKERIILYY
jgi:hypothetical protein